MARPKTLILIALAEHITAAVAQLPVDQRYTVRHGRHRNTADNELNCLSIEYVGEDPTGQGNGGDGLSLAEEVVGMQVNLKAEARLPSEESGLDPTGLGSADEILEHAFSCLFHDGQETETLGGLLWQIRWDGSSDDDELSTEELGRLSERLTLLYRVRSENPNSILM